MSITYDATVVGAGQTGLPPTQGLIKVVLARDWKTILGGTILGVGGDEAVHCILTAMFAKSPASLL